MVSLEHTDEIGVSEICVSKEIKTNPNASQWSLLFRLVTDREI